MSVVSAQQEENDRHAEQELLCWGVLCTIVDLLPHIQVVVRSCVELKRYPSNVVKHEIRTEHVRDIRQSPRCLLRDAGHDIVEDLEAYDQDEVDGPGSCLWHMISHRNNLLGKLFRYPMLPKVGGQALIPRVVWGTQDCLLTFCIDPVRIAVGEGGAVTQLLDRLGRLVIYLEKRARPPPTGRILFRHFVHTSSTRRIGTRVVGDGTLEENWGRQFGGIVGNRGSSGIVSSTGGTDEGFRRRARQGGLPWVRRLGLGRRCHDRAGFDGSV